MSYLIIPFCTIGMSIYYSLLLIILFALVLFGTTLSVLQSPHPNLTFLPLYGVSLHINDPYVFNASGTRRNKTKTTISLILRINFCHILSFTIPDIKQKK